MYLISHGLGIDIFSIALPYRVIAIGGHCRRLRRQQLLE